MSASKNSKTSPSGLFITFEGGDGVGKSTLIEGVQRAFQQRGEKFLFTRAPGGTAAGKAIRDIVLNKGELPLSDRCELLLFLADRAEHVDKLIKPALQEGKTVLCDRFNDSTIVYQGVARGLDPSLVEDLCLFATDELKPHLTLYLDLDPELGKKRISSEGKEADRIEKEGTAFHETVRQAYLDLAKKEPERIKILDASLSKEKVLENALKEIDALVSPC